MSIEPDYIRQKLNAAFESIQRETGIEIKVGTLHYDASTFDVNISGVVAADKAALFDKYAAKHNPIFVGQLNRHIRFKHQTYKIVDFNAKAQRYWLIVQLVDNQGSQKQYRLDGKNCILMGY